MAGGRPRSAADPQGPLPRAAARRRPGEQAASSSTSRGASWRPTGASSARPASARAASRRSSDGRAASATGCCSRRSPGVELWQVGEMSGLGGRWRGGSGGFHARFAGRSPSCARANPLPARAHSDGWFRPGGSGRRRGELVRSTRRARAALAAALGRLRRRSCARLADLPRTFVHGELYPSNVLVVAERRALGVYPGGLGDGGDRPGADRPRRAGGGLGEAPSAGSAASAYVEGLGGRRGRGSGDAREIAEDVLAAGRLHLALQWLGWARTGCRRPSTRTTGWARR